MVSNIKAIAFAGMLAGLAGSALADSSDLSVQQVKALHVVSLNITNMPNTSAPDNILDMPSASDYVSSSMPSAFDNPDLQPALAALSDNPAALEKDLLTPSSASSPEEEKSVGWYVKKALFSNLYVEAYKALTANPKPEVNTAQQKTSTQNSDFSPL